LDEFASPVRLLVQWVPHGYGYRSMNLPFAWWVARRAWREGTEVDLVLHEPYLGWSMNPARLVAAAMHRLMLAVSARAAARLWITIPAWASSVRGYARATVPVRWLPVPSPIPAIVDPIGVAGLRKELAPRGELLVGHFGSYSPLVTPLLAPVLERILESAPLLRIVLIGQGSREFAKDFGTSRTQFEGRLHATGAQEASVVSRHLQVCDVMVQPYPDGVSSRRTTMVAILAHGRPAVTNRGILTDAVWLDSGAVELMPSSAPEVLANAVMNLVQDQVSRARLSAEARRLHDRIFDVRHIVATLTDEDPISAPATAMKATR
jgi:glycosyltransferase involved in cell wall biosynthesis